MRRACTVRGELTAIFPRILSPRTVHADSPGGRLYRISHSRPVDLSRSSAAVLIVHVVTAAAGKGERGTVLDKSRRACIRRRR